MSVVSISARLGRRRSAARTSWTTRALILIGLVAVLGYVYCQAMPTTIATVKGDGEGYYAYLPAIVLEHDPSFATLAARHPHNAGGDLVPGVLQPQPSGRYLVKYSAGVAVLALPFFAAGHLAALATGAVSTGYGSLEEYVTGLAAVAAGLLGLLALRALLRRWFTEPVVAVTLLAGAFGTGLLHWMVYDPLYSHAYSFAAVAACLLCAVRWRERPDAWSRAALCGLAAGIVMLLRIPNVVIIAPVVLIGVSGPGSLRPRLHALRSRPGRVALAAACALAPLVPQEILWADAMGRWLSSPYGGEGFHWAAPAFSSLLSFRPHGLVPYTPILVLAALGVPVLWRRHPDLRWPVTAAIAASTYVICAWADPTLGVGFGQRAFVDVAPVFLIALAALLSSVWTTRLRIPALVLCVALTSVTVLGMIAYWEGRLPHDGAAAGDYVHVLSGGTLPGSLDAN